MPKLKRRPPQRVGAPVARGGGASDISVKAAEFKLAENQVFQAVPVFQQATGSPFFARPRSLTPKISAYIGCFDSTGCLSSASCFSSSSSFSVGQRWWSR